MITTPTTSGAAPLGRLQKRASRADYDRLQVHDFWRQTLRTRSDHEGFPVGVRAQEGPGQSVRGPGVAEGGILLYGRAGGL